MIRRRPTAEQARITLTLTIARLTDRKVHLESVIATAQEELSDVVAHLEPLIRAEGEILVPTEAFMMD